jgi:hypothetical protein
MEEIKKDMLEDEDENGDDEYMDRMREVSGTGLVNTRIADRESEVRTYFECFDLTILDSSSSFCARPYSINRNDCNELSRQAEATHSMERRPCAVTKTL